MPSTPEQRARRAAQARARRHRDPALREREHAANRRYYWKNREKRLIQGKAWRAKPENRARLREHDRKRYSDPNYHLKEQARANAANKAKRAFLAGRSRPDVCDVCGRNNDNIVFDHSHQKGHFRGWLCRNCNWTLGLVEDKPEILLKLISYLKRTKNDASLQLALPGI